MRKKPKLVRINPKFSGEKFFGFTPKELLNTFKVWLPAKSSVRLYRTQTGEVVVKCVREDGSQALYSVKQGREKPSLEYIGEFSPWFDNRQIFRNEFRRKGIATKALKSFIAMQRTHGNNRFGLASGRKSTLLLLLANGFEVDYSNESLFHRIKIKRLLKRLKTNPDSVNEDLPVTIHVKWEKKNVESKNSIEKKKHERRKKQ